MDTLLQDLRYALRTLRKSPAFAMVAVLMLGLGIGANTAIFSVVNQLLVRPLRYRDADRLMVIEATRDFQGAPRPVRASFPLDAARQWHDALHTLDDVTYYSSTVFQLSTRDGSEVIDGADVAPSFFSVLGGQMLAGRAIGPADAMTPSIVISDRLWMRLFNASAEAIGARLTLNTQTYTVIGVAGSDWDIPSWHTDIWDSAPFAHILNPQCCGVQLLGRLKPGATVGQAASDLRDTAHALEAIDARSFGRLHPTVTPLREKQLGDSRTALLLLWAAVSVVLLLACTNLLNLLIARNLGRTRETAIRQALGASRRRLLQQGLTESAILAAGGVACGLVLARVSAIFLARVNPETFPGLHAIHLDPTVVAFAVGLGLLATCSTGLLPSVNVVSGEALRTITTAPTRRHRLFQQLLCIAQLGAGLVLLVSAILLGRSFVALLHTDLGVIPEHVTTASINLAFGRQHLAGDIAATMQRVVDRVQHEPGVLAAGASTSLPPNASRMTLSLKRKGEDVDYLASAVSCSPGYFQALGLRLLEGRFFTSADDAQHPAVIIVSTTTARHLFGRDDPLGQTFTVPNFRYKLTSTPEATVVGVVADVKYAGMDSAPGDQVYWPLAQAPWLSTFLTVRTAADVNLAATLRHIVASVDPTVSVSAITPLDGLITTATAPARFRTVLIVTFAMLGLSIASIGLYGVMAYAVSQRTPELGVRLALGARPNDLISLVLREGLGLAAAGTAIGLPAAYAISRGFAALLFGVQPTDALTYVVSVTALLLAAFAASYLPARRAARVDPMIALRAE